MQSQHIPVEISESSLGECSTYPSLMIRFDFEQALIRITPFQCVHLPVAVAAEENEVFIFVASTHVERDVRTWACIAQCSYVAHLSNQDAALCALFLLRP